MGAHVFASCPVSSLSCICMYVHMEHSIESSMGV